VKFDLKRGKHEAKYHLELGQRLDDRDAGRKHHLALELLETIWKEPTGAISTQVLQEFYVNVTRKILNPLSTAKARGIIEPYRA